ncbi:MAG: translocation/assembly module TamB domain-containing protein, partial [Janthinobacterium lividum]
RAPVKLTAALTGLPERPAGSILGEGALAGAPIQLALKADRTPDGTLHATIDRADWRSFHAEGAVTLPQGATLPLGRVALRMTRLEDLRPLLGQPVAGALTATATLDPAAVVVEAEARNAAFQANRVGAATLKARIANPLAHPVVTASLDASGLDAAGTTGTARVEVAGPQDALAVKTTANLVTAGTQAQVAATALLDAVGKQLRLQTAQATLQNPSLKPETVRLTAPATIRFAEAVSVDRLRVAVRQATLDVAGRLSPTLDATIALRTPADIGTILSPDYAADGSITLDAKLTGPTAQPSGTVRLAATGVRLRTGPGRAVPPANLEATAQLAGSGARVNARLQAGSAALTVNGQAPLGAGALNLQANGNLDLALLDPILTADGRRARGRVTVNASVGGTLAAPRLGGTAQLAGGEVQDFTQGVRISDLAASARLDGDTIRLGSLTGRAGPGTIAASGTIGVLAPALPVDIAVTLRNARPLASDQVSANLDADLTVKGAVQTGLAAAGSVTIRAAELRVPRTLPASVVTLNVRRPGDKPQATASASAPIALDLTIRAPNAVYLRGRGIDAEMQGTLRIRGSSANPQVSGGLEMRRGSISVAGTTLTFTRGKIGFDGTGVSGKIDPTLDFAADSTAGGVTATLSITGYVSKPVIKLSSVPDLPQDEVLAYLIFKRSAKELGPFQIASIAAALAELSGVGGEGGLNPLESVRKGLGLDRLSVGSGSGTGSGTSSSSAGSTPTIEAGRYVANGVYVGAKQGTSGAQTQATVQIDITKGLKVETDVGSGTGGNQVGLTYQFEY